MEHACEPCAAPADPCCRPVVAQAKKPEGGALSEEAMKSKAKSLLAELYNTKDVKEGLTCVRWAPGVRPGPCGLLVGCLGEGPCAQRCAACAACSAAS